MMQGEKCAPGSISIAVSRYNFSLPLFSHGIYDGFKVCRAFADILWNRLHFVWALTEDYEKLPIIRFKLKRLEITQ